MSRPYSVAITVTEEGPDSTGRTYRREWRLPAGVVLTQAKLAPAASFILEAVAELDSDPFPFDSTPTEIG
jgi:hypothetical protein